MSTLRLLKFIEKTFSSSYEEEFSVLANVGRPSNGLNEDDYDYAILLKPDHEYSQVAALDINYSDPLVQIYEEKSDTNSNIDLTNWNEKLRNHKFNENSESKADHLGTNAINKELDFLEDTQWIAEYCEKSDCDDVNNVNEHYFLGKMLLLSKQKTWIEHRSRRSSMRFMDQHILRGNNAIDAFKIAIAKGVSVRRHQPYKFAEMVRLFSKDDCVTFQWEPADASSFRKILIQKHEQVTTDILGDVEQQEAKGGSFALTSCAASCCRDDLYSGISITSNSDANRVSSSFINAGFKRHGSIEQKNIIDIQPSTREDPTTPGCHGSPSLRQSSDIYNSELSFSLVSNVVNKFLRDDVAFFDLECSNEEEYFLLLGGFLYLRRITAMEDAKHRFLAEQQRLESNKENLQKVNNKASIWKQFALPALCKGEGDEDDVELATMEEGACMQQAQQDPDEGTAFSINIEIQNAKEKARIARLFNSPHIVKNTSSSNQQQQQQQQQTFYDLIKSHNLIPPAQFLGWNTKGTQVWARLRMAGLDVFPVFSWDLHQVILKVRCPAWRLEEVAEKMHIRLKTRSGQYKRFKISHRDSYVKNAQGLIFHSSDRQAVIDFILRSKIKDGGAELDESSELGGSIAQRFPLHMTSRVLEFQHSWILFWKTENRGDIPKPWSPFTQPLAYTINKVSESVRVFMNGALNQPLDDIAEYYGDGIAFYFAWVAYTARWLIIPAVFGFIVFCVQLASGQMDHWMCIPYAFFIVVWASFMLVFWRQKSSALAYRWGVLGYEIEETERPQFVGRTVYDPSTQEMRKVYTSWERWKKYCVVVPIMMVMVTSMLLLMMIILLSQEIMTMKYNTGLPLSMVPTFDITEFAQFRYANTSSTVHTNSLGFTSMEAAGDARFWMTAFYYPSLYGMLVAIVAEFVNRFAVTLNNFENHRKQSTYLNRLILKIFCFRFIAVFTPIFYYAYWLPNSEDAYLRMSVGIFTLMTVGDWWSKFLDACLPMWISRFKLYQMRGSLSKMTRKIWSARNATNESIKQQRPTSKKGWSSSSFTGTSASNASGKKMAMYSHQAELIDRRERHAVSARSACWEEALKRDYSAIEDYTSSVIQLSYVLLFGAVFPLAPLIVLLNSVVFMRVNAAKLLLTRKRPIAQKIGGLGIWEDIMQIISVIGIMNNCCLLAFTSKRLVGLLSVLGTGGVVMFLLGFEHSMLLMKYFLHTSISRIPECVERDQERKRNIAATKKNITKNNFTRNEPFFILPKPDDGNMDVNCGSKCSDSISLKKPSVERMSSFPRFKNFLQQITSEWESDNESPKNSNTADKTRENRNEIANHALEQSSSSSEEDKRSVARSNSSSRIPGPVTLSSIRSMSNVKVEENKKTANKHKPLKRLSMLQRTGTDTTDDEKIEVMWRRSLEKDESVKDEIASFASEKQLNEVHSKAKEMWEMPDDSDQSFSGSSLNGSDWNLDIVECASINAPPTEKPSLREAINVVSLEPVAYNATHSHISPPPKPAFVMYSTAPLSQSQAAKETCSPSAASPSELFEKPVVAMSPSRASVLYQPYSSTSPADRPQPKRLETAGVGVGNMELSKPQPKLVTASEWLRAKTDPKSKTPSPQAPNVTFPSVTPERVIVEVVRTPSPLPYPHIIGKEEDGYTPEQSDKEDDDEYEFSPSPSQQPRASRLMSNRRLPSRKPVQLEEMVADPIAPAVHHNSVKKAYRRQSGFHDVMHADLYPQSSTVTSSPSYIDHHSTSENVPDNFENTISSKHVTKSNGRVQDLKLSAKPTTPQRKLNRQQSMVMSAAKLSGPKNLSKPKQLSHTSELVREPQLPTKRYNQFQRPSEKSSLDTLSNPFADVVGGEDSYIRSSTKR